MHGRLKVRTTEEERERKKKEQVLKVKAYRSTMSKIQDKRRRQELDDEMLQLTALVLLRNPDVTTLWNIRRECVQQKTNLDQQQAVYDAELKFSEQCLLVNPKSYNGWHHRCWILEHSPKPDWEQEVKLCSKYLKMDERNFHTWDYRRYVAEKAEVSRENELDFCTEKIKANFSNYSSWHHRSLLLPIVYPYEGDAMPKPVMRESLLKEELEMVLTAAFTDPNDSSAWFYQRWLLGYSRQELEVCAFRYGGNRAVLSFTNPITVYDGNIALADVEEKKKIKFENWKPLNGSDTDTTWVCYQSETSKLMQDRSIILHINIPDTHERQIVLKFYNNSVFYFKQPNPSLVFTGSVMTELQSQLESCESLLEYEPDSKWTLLTSALLMRAIDPQSYHEKSLKNLEQLQKVDALRKNYYLDMSSKWIMEKLLSDWAESQDVPKTLDLRHEKRLNGLFYPQYLCIIDNILLPETFNHKDSQFLGFNAPKLLMN